MSLLVSTVIALLGDYTLARFSFHGKGLLVYVLVASVLS